MSISKRLETICSLVTPGLRSADIGTDHGYVPIYLLKNHLAPSAIAVDLSEGSLNKARENIAKAGLQEHIECRRSDGLQAIAPGEVDAIIIAGMGGILMDRILRDGIEVVKNAKELILSPHRDSDLLRAFAKEFCWDLTQDLLLTDKKKTYPLLRIEIRSSQT